jgi:hypothetical protein
MTCQSSVCHLAVPLYHARAKSTHLLVFSVDASSLDELCLEFLGAVLGSVVFLTQAKTQLMTYRLGLHVNDDSVDHFDME